jgi:signal transduction histidine kinase
VRLAVANGGPVIEPAVAETLLEPFRRLDRSVSGFGLGLSIVRSVVVAHHGTTTLEAPREGGLTIEITLPAAAPKSSVIAPRTAGALT